MGSWCWRRNNCESFIGKRGMKKNQRVTDFKSKMSQNEKLTRMYVYNTI